MSWDSKASFGLNVEFCMGKDLDCLLFLIYKNFWSNKWIHHRKVLSCSSKVLPIDLNRKSNGYNGLAKNYFLEFYSTNIIL